MGEPWNVPIAINDTGTRAVVETSWGISGQRCQMIWSINPDGTCTVTTCNPDVPSILLNAAQMDGLAYFLRNRPHPSSG